MNSSDEPDHKLVDKLKSLLDEQEHANKQRSEDPSDLDGPVEYEQERFLTAWVLLTRLSQYELDQAWSDYGSVLEPFAMEDLLSETVIAGCDDEESSATNETSSRTTICCLYLRLVAQVTARLTNYPPTLGHSLLEAWGRLVTMELHQAKPHMIPVSVHIDACRSLGAWMQQDPAGAEENGLLESMWKHYFSLSSSHSSSHASEPMNTLPDETLNPNKNDARPNRSTREWAMMAQTLEGILNDQGNSNNDDLDSGSESWDEVIFDTIQTHGNELMSDNMVPSVVQWLAFSSKSLESWIRLGWHEWFLTFAQTRIKFDEVFRLTVLRHPVTVTYLNQILLSHVVSPVMGGDGNSLRALAWQTTLTLVEFCGWNWMSMAATNCSTSTTTDVPQTHFDLSSAKNLCTWVRLASGEWRIQLEMQASSTSNSGSAWQQATGLPMGHACAKLLMAIIHYCIHLEEQPPGTSSLSADALLHIRQSLQDALWTTIEYLREFQQGNKILSSLDTLANSSTHSAPSSSSNFFSISIELLGTLLMEINIWKIRGDSETSFPEAAANNCDETKDGMYAVAKGILECLQVLLPDLEEEYSLLPGLVSILAGADESRPEEKARITELLVDFWDPLVDFLEGYWQHEPNTLAERLDDTVTWACSCTELFVQLDDDDDDVDGGDNNNSGSERSALDPKRRQRRRRLAMSLIEWIQGILQTESHEFRQAIIPTLQSHMSIVLGCYMALQKDVTGKPGEHENRVILRGLQICEMQSQSSPQSQPQSQANS